MPALATLAILVLCAMMSIPAAVAASAGTSEPAPYNASYLCSPFTSRGRHKPEPRFETQGKWDNRTMAFSAAPGVCFASGISHSRALSCLRNQHIVFMGDSVTRFQYIAFVHFIHKGMWIHDWVKGEKNHLLWEATWENWREYLIGSCNFFHPFMACDVFRYVPGIDAHHWRENNTDNRYYFNPEFNINISYIGVHQDAKGHFPMAWRPGPPKSIENYKHDRDFDFHGSYGDLAGVMARQMGPIDALFVNEGIWGTEPLGNGGARAVADMRLFTDPGPPTLLKARAPVWMTTTPMIGKGRDAMVKELGNEAVEAGWPILDRHAMLMSVYRALKGVSADGELASEKQLEDAQQMAHFDQAHVRAFVNRAFGEAVLGMLCPAP